MNSQAYEKESHKLSMYTGELFNFLDRLKGELQLSSWEEQTGKQTKDSIDDVKAIFIKAERQVQQQNASMDLLYRMDQQMHAVAEAFAYDPTIVSMLDNIKKSLHNLYYFSQEDEEEGEDE